MTEANLPRKGQDDLLGKSAESAWHRLRRHLDRANTFWFGVILTSNRVIADSLTERAARNRRHAKAPFLLLRPKTPFELANLLHTIEGGPKPPGCTWVEAVHLPDSEANDSEDSLTWSSAWITLLQSLNHRRDTLRSRLGGLVLLCPPLVKSHAMQVSTDLWSVLAFLAEISESPDDVREDDIRAFSPADSDSAGSIISGSRPVYQADEDLEGDAIEDFSFLLEADDSSLVGPLRDRLSMRIEWALEHGHQQSAASLMRRRAVALTNQGKLEIALVDLARAA